MLSEPAIQEVLKMTRKRPPPALHILLLAAVVLLPGVLAAGSGQGHAHAAGSSAVASSAAPAQDGGHDHEGTGHGAVSARDWPRPPAGSRWASDAALREGMARLHGALDALEGMARAGRHDPELVRARSRAIDEAVAFVFAHCKLDPEPDAALHHLLAAVLGASARLGETPGDLAPVADLREALSHYPHLFED